MNNPQNPQNPKNPKKREIKLHLPPDLEVVYSNLAVMSMTRNEIIFDFAQMLPPDPRAKVQTRVVMTPQHAKLVLTLLQRNIERYEAEHGAIQVNVPPSLAEQLFNSIQPEQDDSDDE